ncbi:hypothetical protein D046_1911B, partial [Vibrio parahaemolyticus V-223/04]
PSYR